MCTAPGCGRRQLRADAAGLEFLLDPRQLVPDLSAAVFQGLREGLQPVCVRQQFLDVHAPPHRLAHGAHQAHAAHVLHGQVVLGAKSQDLQRPGLVVVARQDDDVHVRRRPLQAQTGVQPQAVGQPQVQQDDVGARQVRVCHRVHLAERLLRIGQRADRIDAAVDLLATELLAREAHVT